MERFRRARGDSSLAVLEGFHPLKHALRFGAELIEVVCLGRDELDDLGADLAPDIASGFDNIVELAPPDVFERLAPVSPPTGVIAIARRPSVSLEKVLNSPTAAPVVLLENPRNLLNIGAAVRVSAAAGAAGVITTGVQDPWHAAALIAGTGLHYAIPVVRTAALPQCDRPLVVVHPGGEPLEKESIPSRSILAFGAERGGITSELLGRADRCISIPMCAGVSSLNLATAVAVVVYSWRFGHLNTENIESLGAEGSNQAR